MTFELPAHLAADPTLLRNLVLPLRDAINETFTQSDWTEFGYGCGLEQQFRDHPRLYRSLSWGDEDYPERIVWALESVIREAPGALALLFGHPRVGAWLGEHRPQAIALWHASSAIAREALAARRPEPDFNVSGHYRRLLASLDSDPALAIGSTKELIETILRHVLEQHGVDFDDMDIPQLFREVMKRWGMTITADEPVGSALRRFLGGLSQTVSSLAELRNAGGTGHGRTEPDEIAIADAALVVTAGLGLADWLVRRHRQLPSPERSIERRP